MDVAEEGLGVDSPELLAGITNALNAEAGIAPEKAEQPEGTEQPEAEQPEAEQPEAEQAQDDTIEIDPDAPVFEVQVTGVDGKAEARKLSLSELQNSYAEREQLRTQNQELQRATNSVDMKIREAVAPIAQHYQQNIQVLQKAVWNLASKELANVDFSRLAQEDPAEAVRLSARAQEIQTVLQAAQEELIRTQQQEQQQAEKQYREQAQKSVELLKRELPGWGPELYSTVLKAGVEMYGFTPDEVGSTVDARHIKVLHDAYKYRQLQAAKPNITKRVVNVPKMLKPGTTNEDNRSNSKAGQIQARFKKSGSVEDMAALLLATGKG